MPVFTVREDLISKTVSYDFKSVFNLRMISKLKDALKSDFVLLCFKLNYYNHNSSEEGVCKSDSNQCWVYCNVLHASKWLTVEKMISLET